MATAMTLGVALGFITWKVGVVIVLKVALGIVLWTITAVTSAPFIGGATFTEHVPTPFTQHTRTAA